MAAFFFALLCVLSCAQIQLQDGVVAKVTIDEVTGGSRTFSFFVESSNADADLYITTTTFSDWGSPELFVSAGKIPTIDNHEYTSSPFSIEELEISASELHENTEYYILVRCATYCRFNLLATLKAEVKLPAGMPLRFALDAHQVQVFIYEVQEPSLSRLAITLTPFGHSSALSMTVAEGGPSGPQEPVTSGWLIGLSCTVKDPKRTSYWISVIAQEDVRFEIAAEAGDSVTLLRASTPVYGVVGYQEWKQFQVYVDDPQSTVYVMETLYSGSPAVYIRAGAPPTLDSYDFVSLGADNETIAIDKHQRAALNHSTGLYFIGVYGKVPSAFVLTASVNIEGMVPLHSGMTYSGYVEENERFYFYMELPPKATIQVSVKVQMLAGDLRLYVKFCQGWILHDTCKVTDAELENPQVYFQIHTPIGDSSTKEVKFEHSASLCPDEICRYTILVLGQSRQRSTFLISPSILDNTIHSLLSGIASTFSVTQKSSIYLKHRVIDQRVSSVSFQLTVFTGSCFLCVSPFEEKPSAGECLKYAKPRGDPNDQGVTFVKGSDFESLNMTFYATVRAEEPASFSILATEVMENSETAIRLFQGQIQRDIMHRGEMQDQGRFYSFDLHYTEEKKQDVFLTVTPFAGDFELFISNNASSYASSHIFHYQWSSQNSTDSPTRRKNALQLRTTDPGYLAISTYLVLLRVTNWPGNSPASYSIVYTSEVGVATTLQKGTPINDFVTAGNYRFYDLPIHFSNQTLTITVSALTGDPDLYLSLNRSNRFPSNTWFDIASATYGSEVQSLLWDGRSGAGRLYISVFGYTDSEYVLMATVEDGNPTFLIAGKPQIGKTSRTEYRFFSAFVDPNEYVQVTVQFFVGEAELFANWQGVVKNQTTDWTKPTSQMHMASGSPLFGFSRLSLQPSDLSSHCSSSVRCRLDLSILCTTLDCRFETTVSQSAEIQLSEGTLTIAVCGKSSPVMFHFHNELDSTNIAINVAAVTNGDPDVYVSKEEKPEASKYMWSSVSWGNEFLEIPNSDSRVGPSMMRGDYYMLVLCDRNMNFSASVTTSPKSLRRLQNGQPQEGFLHGKSANYYFYPSALPEDIIISLTVRSGSVMLYGLTHDDSDQDIYERLPNSTFYMWQSPANQELTISYHDSLFCTGCNIVLGVHNTDVSCLYNILVRNAGHITTLLNGQPLGGRITERETRKYVFLHGDNSSLDISLSVFAGLPRLFVDTTPLVSESRYLWKTHRHSPVQHVHIPVNDSNFRIGLYYAMVDAKLEEASYSLTAHSSNSVVKVMTGWPQTYATDIFSKFPLAFEYLASGAGGSCKVISDAKDFYPTVYASFTPYENIGSVTTSTNYDFVFTTYNIFYELFIPLWAHQSGKYQFAVYGNSTKPEGTQGIGSFQLYCLSGNNTKVIVLQEVEYGVVDVENQQQEYMLHLSQTGVLWVIVSPCSGQVEVTVVRRDGTEKEIRVKRMQDGRITVELSSRQGDYMVHVMGLNSEELKRGVSFELTTYFSPTSQLSSLGPIYYAGNGGDISWREFPKGHLYLSWAPPETMGGDTIPSPQMVKYRLYATAATVPLTSACGMDTYEKLGLAWLLLSDTEEYGATNAIVNIPLQKQIRVNVLAIIDPESGPELYHVPYLQTEVELGATVEEEAKEKEMHFILLALAGIIALLVIAVALLVWKYRSAKKLQMRLVEMMGVEVISMDFNKSLKSARGRPQSLEFSPLPQESYRSA